MSRRRTRSRHSGTCSVVLGTSLAGDVHSTRGDLAPAGRSAARVWTSGPPGEEPLGRTIDVEGFTRGDAYLATASPLRRARRAIDRGLSRQRSQRWRRQGLRRAMAGPGAGYSGGAPGEAISGDPSRQATRPALARARARVERTPRTAKAAMRVGALGQVGAVGGLDTAAGERSGESDAERGTHLAACRRDCRRQAGLRARHARYGGGVDRRADAPESHAEDGVRRDEHEPRGVTNVGANCHFPALSRPTPA